MNCARIDQLKEAYVDGTLAPEVRAAIDAHTFECADCRRKLALARQVRASMGGAIKAAVGRPYMSRERVSRIQDNLERRTAPGAVLVIRRRTIAVPAVILLLFISVAVSTYQLGMLASFVNTFIPQPVIQPLPPIEVPN